MTSTSSNSNRITSKDPSITTLTLFRIKTKSLIMKLAPVRYSSRRNVTLMITNHWMLRLMATVYILLTRKLKIPILTIQIVYCHLGEKFYLSKA